MKWAVFSDADLDAILDVSIQIILDTPIWHTEIEGNTELEEETKELNNSCCWTEQLA